MRFFILLPLFCAVLLGAGCATSRVVVEDSRSPEIIIDKFGDVIFYGKRISPDAVGKAAVSAKLPKEDKVRIAIPENPNQDIIGRVAGSLGLKGYMPVFLTERKATVDYKAPVTKTPAKK